MSLAFIHVALMALGWCLIAGSFTAGQFLLGLGAGMLFTLLTGAGRGRSVAVAALLTRLYYLAVYLLAMLPYEIARSNLDMAWRLLRAEPLLRPGIVRVPLGDVSEATSALVAHAMTVSPGELVVDYAPDGRTIYIHMIDVTDAELRRSAFWRTYRTVLHRVFS